MRWALAALLVLTVSGCRGDDAAPPDEQDGPVTRQFDDIESTLADIESDLNGD